MPEKIWNEKNPYPKPSAIASRVEAIGAALWLYDEHAATAPDEWFAELWNRREQLKAWK